MDWLECAHMNISNFPEDIFYEFNLRDIATKDGFIIAECKNASYGFPQEDNLAGQFLENDKIMVTTTKVTSSMDYGPTKPNQSNLH